MAPDRAVAGRVVVLNKNGNAISGADGSRTHIPRVQTECSPVELQPHYKRPDGESNPSLHRDRVMS